MSLKKLILHASVYSSMLAFFIELPTTIVVELLYSFGEIDKTSFTNFKIIVGGAVIVSGALNMLFNRAHWMKMGVTLFYCALYLQIFLIVSLNSDEIASNSTGDTLSAVKFFTPILFKYLVYFFIGMNLIYFEKFRLLLLAGAIICGVTIVQYVDFEIMRIDVVNYIEGASRGNYQFIGDACAVLSLMVLALYKGVTIRVIFAIASACIIFLVGSRR